MARLPYAAKQFIEQVQAHKPKATFENAADPDGLNVVRTIKFDKRTSKWLAPVMDQFADMDERIADYDLTTAGYLHVTFAPGPVADSREAFLLDEAVTVTQEPEPPTPVTEPEATPPE